MVDFRLEQLSDAIAPAALHAADTRGWRRSAMHIGRRSGLFGARCRDDQRWRSRASFGVVLLLSRPRGQQVRPGKQRQRGRQSCDECAAGEDGVVGRPWSLLSASRSGVYGHLGRDLCRLAAQRRAPDLPGAGGRRSALRASGGAARGQVRRLGGLVALKVAGARRHGSVVPGPHHRLEFGRHHPQVLAAGASRPLRTRRPGRSHDLPDAHLPAARNRLRHDQVREGTVLRHAAVPGAH
mmetsp:Transcript_98812/g.316774  ORF Transcript_98812/g.316774 Transcript_98812/m.316774 type:complete len:239 (+) Transcript_98812:658-1374(+)